MKKLKSDTLEARHKFTNEAVLLNKLDHPYIVRLLGVYNRKTREPCLVFEYVSGGNLKNHLVSHADDRDIPVVDLIEVCFNVLAALAYCHDNFVLHKDISARNVLISKTSSGIEGKLSDFGLSTATDFNEVDTSAESSRSSFSIDLTDTEIPVRWTAPEVLKGAPTTKSSEIYSFGSNLTHFL